MTLENSSPTGRLPPSPSRRHLKGAAQLLPALLHLGRAGISPELVAALDEALQSRELVKVRFVEHKDKKRTLAPALAEATRSRLVLQVGHVAVYYRPRSGAASPKA